MPLLHAHLAFVTTNQLTVRTGKLLNLREDAMLDGCVGMGVKLAKIEGEADNVSLLVAYPPAVAISSLVQRLNASAVNAERHECTACWNHARVR